MGSLPKEPPIPVIFTVGHSNREVPLFIDLLNDNAIQVVVDVRSAPYSRYVPQFNKREIEIALNRAGFRYIFMGDAIGGKPSESRYIDNNGKTNYRRLAESEKFQQGVDRLQKGMADGWTIALMCAEEDPFNCHRHLLIANELEMKREIQVWHLRADGSRIRAKKYLKKPDTQLRLF